MSWLTPFKGFVLSNKIPPPPTTINGTDSAEVLKIKHKNRVLYYFTKI